MPKVTASVRSLLKTVLSRTPLGSRVESWYMSRGQLKDLLDWTATDEAALGFYAQFVGPNDICFDIGANHGARTKIFRRLAAKVVAVEPQRDCRAFLADAYAGDAKVAVVSAACGAARGRGTIRMAASDQLSSLSEEWISAVKQSGRFGDFAWTREQPCELVTLDDLMERHGRPAFIKIDVEGYEWNVLQGLTRAVPCVSYEFIPERPDSALDCADYLCALGLKDFNISWGETFKLFLDSWIGRSELASLLHRYREDKVIFGDIYARQGGAKAEAGK